MDFGLEPTRGEPKKPDRMIHEDLGGLCIITFRSYLAHLACYLSEASSFSATVTMSHSSNASLVPSMFRISLANPDAREHEFSDPFNHARSTTSLCTIG